MPIPSRLARTVRRLFFAGVAAIALAATALIADGLLDNAQIADVGIVLGSKVELDGKPSDRLRARLDRAADLYRAGLFGVVIVSGGTGVEGYSEADVMADYLVVERGLPRAAVILDRHGDTTEATARNAAAIMRRLTFTSATVVTQYFHVTRCRLALRAAGVDTVYSAHARIFEVRDVYSTLRELVAVPAYSLRHWRAAPGA